MEVKILYIMELKMYFSVLYLQSQINYYKL